MRQFSAEYLRETRRGMWESREALADLQLETRECVLDAGCGTGELARVLAEECPGEVVGTDADLGLLEVARQAGAVGDANRDHSGNSDDHPANPDGRLANTVLPVVAGDALRLPFRDDSFDLAVCQALLINLPDPPAAVREFRRVSSDLVAAIEPDNSAVSVESTVEAEGELAARARRAYLRGVETDVTLGGDGVAAAFREAGLSDVSTRRYYHTRRVEPPYERHDLQAARRKVSGEGLADDRATLLEGGLSTEEYQRLRGRWREMGRSVVKQMQDDAYRRAEVVPFYVTVGSV